MVQRNLAAVKEPAGQTAITHEPGDAPPPKQEVSLTNDVNTSKFLIKMIFLDIAGAQAVQFTTWPLLQRECPRSVGPADWCHWV